MERAFSPCIHLPTNLGRCPRLLSGAPLALKKTPRRATCSVVAFSSTYGRPTGATPRLIVAWGNAPGIAVVPPRAEGPAHAVGTLRWSGPSALAANHRQTWGVAPGYYRARRWRSRARLRNGARLRDATWVARRNVGSATERVCAAERGLRGAARVLRNGATPRAIVAWGNAPGLEPKRHKGRRPAPSRRARSITTRPRHVPG